MITANKKNPQDNKKKRVCSELRTRHSLCLLLEGTPQIKMVSDFPLFLL